MARFIMTMATTLLLAAPASAVWTIYNIPDDFGEKTQYGMSNSGEAQNWLSMAPRAFLVCSDGGRPQLGIVPGYHYLELNDHVKVTVRVDDHDVFKLSGWVGKSNNEIAYVNNYPPELIYQMREGRRLLMRVKGYDDTNHDGMVPLAGFTSASNRLSMHCRFPKGWRGEEIEEIDLSHITSKEYYSGGELACQKSVRDGEHGLRAAENPYSGRSYRKAYCKELRKYYSPLRERVKNGVFGRCEPQMKNALDRMAAVCPKIHKKWLRSQGR